ncbi:MAG: response regulator transcription factor [Deltaproteobacteria bacterium]|nr:response regulator transcription factor [Deltaproteobacteria bacterium]
MSRIRVLIADDHAVVRQGLRQILHQAPEIGEIYEAETAQATFDFIQNNPLDILILDISLPDGNGLEMLKQIRKWNPKLPVLILSIFPEEQYALRTLKSGGAGYLTKDSHPDQILSAINKILLGGKYIGDNLASQLAFELGGEKWKTAPYENLSDREFEVLRFITLGKTVSEIANTLHLSVKTISTYRSRILEKTRLKTTADLIRFGMENRIA